MFNYVALKSETHSRFWKGHREERTSHLGGFLRLFVMTWNLFLLRQPENSFLKGSSMGFPLSRGKTHAPRVWGLVFTFILISVKQPADCISLLSARGVALLQSAWKPGEERGAREILTATGGSHYLHPVKNCPISSLDKTRREFKKQNKRQQKNPRRNINLKYLNPYFSSCFTRQSLKIGGKIK